MQTGRSIFAVAEIEAFVAGLFAKVGFEGDVSAELARHLVETERLGRRTHGLINVSKYVDDLRAGRVRPEGRLDYQPAQDGLLRVSGNSSSGIWATATIMEELYAMAAGRPVALALVSNIHHTGCMSVYLRRAVERGFVMLMCSSSPSLLQAVPHGARKPYLSTNPIAFASPAGERPMMLDMATTMVAGSLIRDYRNASRDMPGEWAVDAEGMPSRNPHDPGLMPLGGPEVGYKGTGLALMVEALSQGLSGWGRVSQPGAGQLAVFIQLFNPAFFAGTEALREQLDPTLRSLRDLPAAKGAGNVRAPGDRAVESWAATAEHIELAPPTLDSLFEVAAANGLKLPDPVPPEQSELASA